MDKPLYKCRTFWGGMLAIATALFGAAFAADESLRPIGDILADFLRDPKTWIGVTAIFGRSALLSAVRGSS